MTDYSSLSKEKLIDLLLQKDVIIKKLQDNDDKSMQTHNFASENLSLDCIKRYSRQLILPEIGPKGQILLQKTSVLIVGCGGLGCPSAIYLGAAGIGKIGLVDFDEVEISNLHRQVLHTEARVGMSKAKSIAKSVTNLNSNVQCIAFEVSLNSNTAMSIIENFDIVLDCTDNVATRYLLNDACVLTKKPLVSGSALRFEGQLTVYSYKDGPCYRCLFPQPPPPETVTNCSDGGVLGAVPGTIGCLQAIEAIKIAAEFGEVCFKKMILFDALNMTIRTIKLRSQKESCDICGLNPSIEALIDYEQFCGAKATDKDSNTKLIEVTSRITATDYRSIVDMKVPHLLIDVRSPIEMEICKLSNSINIPLRTLESEDSLLTIKSHLGDWLSTKIVCVCRRGNDSQSAVLALKKHFVDVTDIVGGLTAWAKCVDHLFPVY